VIIQFGVSVFSLDPETGNYVSEVFTIYLFPGTTGRKDSSLKFQASSVEFLCRYQFDFNKVNFIKYFKPRATLIFAISQFYKHFL